MSEEIEETSQLAARPAVKDTQSFLLSFFRIEIHKVCWGARAIKIDEITIQVHPNGGAWTHTYDRGGADAKKRNNRRKEIFAALLAARKTTATSTVRVPNPARRNDRLDPRSNHTEKLTRARRGRRAN